MKEIVDKSKIDNKKDNFEIDKQEEEISFTNKHKFNLSTYFEIINDENECDLISKIRFAFEKSEEIKPFNTLKVDKELLI